MRHLESNPAANSDLRTELIETPVVLQAAEGQHTAIALKQIAYQHAEVRSPTRALRASLKPNLVASLPTLQWSHSFGQVIPKSAKQFKLSL